MKGSNGKTHPQLSKIQLNPIDSLFFTFRENLFSENAILRQTACTNLRELIKALSPDDSIFDQVPELKQRLAVDLQARAFILSILDSYSDF